MSRLPISLPKTCSTLALSLSLGVLFFSPSVFAVDWARFRGPNGSGVSTEVATTPTVWNTSDNLKWKCELPGPGHSCPIVLGDRLYVTSWSGYGIDRNDVGEQSELLRNLSCIDCKTGKIIWNSTVAPYLPEDEYRGMFAEHGYASHTPVSDGERIFVHFGKTGALAFDMDGKQLWQTSVGTASGARDWGTSSSPILYDDLVIVTASAESESLVALDKATGKEVWRQEASSLNSVWGTPILVKVDDQRTDLVLAVTGEIWGLNPKTGKLRWFCETESARSFCSSVVAQDGVVFAVENGPGGGGGVAVRVGGSGDVTESHVVWKSRQGGRIGSPIVHDGLLYSVARGVVNCFDATTGKKVYRGRLQASPKPESASGRGGRGGGQDYSSLVMADGKIYFTSRGGDVYVFGVGSEFKQLAANRVTADHEDFSATPAISNGELFIRSSKYLYCVAQLKDVEAPPIAQVAADAEEDANGGGRGRGGQRGGRQRGGRGNFDPAAFFKQRDANKDGKLSGDEIMGQMRNNLSNIDKDGDEALTLEEFQEGMRQAFRRGGGGRRRGGNQGGGGSRDENRPKRPALEEN